MSQDLVPWINHALKNDFQVSVDPDTLSNLIVAVVRKHKQSRSRREKCVNKLEEFFGDSTERFVNNLLRQVDARDREDHPRRDHSPRDKSPRRKRRISEDREERPPKRRRQSDYHDLDRPSPRPREEGEISPPERSQHSENPGLETWETDREPRSRGRDRYQRHGRDRDRGGRDRDRRGPRGGHRDTTTLVVTNIPKESNSITSLNEHFSQFGTIVNIDVKYAQNKAHVKFTHHQAAQKAFKSPNPIFGNRFIKVFWHKEGDSRASPNKESSSSAPRPSAGVPQNVPPSAARKFPPKPTPKDPAQDAAKLQQLKDLQLQKEELRKKQLEEQQTLMKMLSAPNLDQGTKVTLFKQLKTLTESIEASIKKDSSLLASVRQKSSPSTGPVAPEATATPTDPSEEERIAKMEDKRDQLQAKASSMLYAGRGYPPRGRGRGAPRGFPPRGRGFAPRGRGWHTAPRGHLSIDNRTRTINIENPPAPLLHEETLTTFFKKFGTIENVEIGEQNASVQFSQRREAETAMRSGTTYEDHPLTLSWKEKTYEEVTEGDQQTTEGADATEDSQGTSEKATETQDQAPGATEEASGLSSDDEYWNQ